MIKNSYRWVVTRLEDEQWSRAIKRGTPGRTPDPITLHTPYKPGSPQPP